MRELFPYLRLLAARRLRLLGGALLMLATVLAAVGLLSLSGWFITATAVTAALWAAGLHIAFDVYVPGAAIRFFALTRTAARYFERLYSHDTVLRLLADLRAGVFAALARLDPVSLSRLRAGILLNRLTADIDTLDNLYLRLLAPPAVALLGLAAVAGLLWLFVPLAGLAALLALGLLLALVTSGAAWQGAAISERLVAQAETLRVRLIEQFQGLAELSAYGTLGQHRHLLAREEAVLLADQRRLGRRIAAGNAAVTLGVQLAAVGVLGLGLAAYQAGQITAAGAVLLPLAVMGLGEAFAALPGAFAQAGGTRAAARRLTAETRRRTRRPLPVKPAPLPDRSDIALAAVSFRYPYAEAAVLESIDLQIGAGEHVAIIGLSGTGKSTLADLVAGVRVPDAGTVYLGGTDTTRLPTSNLWQVVAYLTQRTDLFEDTIAANLRIAAPAVAEAALWRALHIVALDEWVARLPDGLDTWVGESGRQLSGGEGRRLALARILLREPRVVVLDEPLAGLDAATAGRVTERLEHWLTGRTAVLVGHTVGALPRASRRFTLAEGRLTAHGEHA